MYRFKPGTVFIERGYSITSKIIRLLVSVRYSIPFKFAHSHISTAYSDSLIGSAEASGYKILDRVKEQEEKDVIAFEFVGDRPRYMVMRGQKREPFSSQISQQDYQDILKKRAGTPYSGWKYLLHSQRILTFWLSIGALLSVPLAALFKWGWMPLVVFGWSIILTLMVGWVARKKIHGTLDCSGSEILNLQLWGAMTWQPYGNPYVDSPNSIHSILCNLAIHGVVRCVGSKHRGGEWVYNLDGEDDV